MNQIAEAERTRVRFDQADIGQRLETYARAPRVFATAAGSRFQQSNKAIGKELTA
ncbi:MAG TPA: hypothetical protein VKM35_12130 [Arenimonas sp.]|uniref:hypothetical protein n=1 Tax=Arenimonas sp. TaxID=1872635 RepID=UPI002BC0002B|nr:hypothetical protein [Arenimonas sp.]HMB57939.1 hypothetical protein [Arenimonas sp.]